MKVFVQDERDMLNTDIFSTVVIQKVDDLEYDSLEDLSTLQKSLDEVKGNADIIDDKNDSNDDDDSSFESSTVSFSVTNESESLLCDPHYDTYFRLLDRTDSETAENQSNCSSETLRRRKVFVEDERNILKTEMFLPFDVEEINESKSLCDFEIVCDENNNKKLVLVNKNLDEVKGDVELLDEGDNDNDNDDKRNNKDHNYDKNRDDGDINTNNEVVNPREYNLKSNDSDSNKTKEDSESLDEVDNDKDNDDKRDDKDNDDNKDSNDDDINIINDERDDNDDNNRIQKLEYREKCKHLAIVKWSNSCGYSLSF